MQINRTDLFWNYGATFLKLASSVLLFPLILKMLSSETVGIWAIFTTLTAFAGLLDFGFSSSFARNVTYVLSGVKTLKVNGFETPEDENPTVDYSLLKGVISTMRWFYSRIAIVLFLFLVTFGSYYVHSLLKTYTGDRQEVYISWMAICLISTYNLFTLYYDALLQGKGLVKRSKQITVIGQSVYLITATTLILAGNGLIAIVSAQATSVLIIRWLSYKSFFTTEMKHQLQTSVPFIRKDLFRAITPNAVKMGLTSLGGFMVVKAAIIIGSMYLSLSEIASYSVTLQLIGIISGLAGIYFGTYQPKIVQLTIELNKTAVKQIYLRSFFVILFSFFVGGLGMLLFAKWALVFIGSKTQLIPDQMILAALVISFLESNHVLAGGVLLSKNEVPFLIPSLLSGSLTILLLLAFFRFFEAGIWPMILAPGIAQALYQNWKWPLVVSKELKITATDFADTLLTPLKLYFHETCKSTNR